MNISKLMNFPVRFGLAAALMVLTCALQGHQVFVSASSATTQKPSDLKANSPAPAASEAPGDDRLFKDIYQGFYETYRLGPSDEIAIRVTGQPDYTLERVKVSPTGGAYHPLLGDLEVAGLTVPQLIDRLTKDLSEYLINPKVSVTLLEANSAKIGMLGDIARPGILVMNRPMNVLEAIITSGGITDTGRKSDVTVLRQTSGAYSQKLTVNVKHILEGKARPEENIALQAGDIVLVHGNAKKKLSSVMSLAGFGSFLSFISMGRR